MTVTTFLNYKEYQAEGKSTQFTIPFLLLDRADLNVFLDNERITSGYTVTGIGNPYSEIIFDSPPVGLLLLQRTINLLRDTDYQENGDLLAETLNRDFDRLYLAMQGVAQDTSKSLRVEDPNGVNVLPLAEERANKTLSFDSLGQPILTTNATGSAAELAHSLADTNDSLKGAGLIGFNNTVDYSKNTLGHALKNIVSLFTTQWWPDRKNIPAGFVAADGQELSNLVYPDVTKALVSGMMPQVTNSVWLSDPTKRGCYVANSREGMFRVPDYNGVQAGSLGALFLRGGSDKVIDGTVQGDAIRNITGNFSVYRWSGAATPQQTVSGTMREVLINNTTLAAGGTVGTALSQIIFDTSRVVPTAEENRPVNVKGCWIIRLFGSINNSGMVDASQLAMEYAKLATRISTLESAQQQKRFTIIYPNGGTEEKPALIRTNSRYVLDNPFPKSLIDCRAEVLIDGLWGASPWQFSESASVIFSRGAIANQLIGDDGVTDQVVLQTGINSIAGWSQNSGSPHGLNVNFTLAPARILVWRID